MKVPAFLLLIPLMAYFLELFQIPRNIPEPAVKTTCCAKIQRAQSAEQIPCKNHNSGKETSNNCAGMNCLNCPLGYNTMIQPGISLIKPFCLAEHIYFPIEEKLDSDYFNKSWKPPKAA
jgi:hypothetical protein